MTNRHYIRLKNTNHGHDPLVCRSCPLVVIGSDEKDPLIRKNMPSVGEINSQFGFTIVELMITLIVAAVIFGIAIPNLRTFIQNARMTTQSNEVIGDFALARSEAIKLNQNVVVCRSANPTAAPPSCGGAGAWETGWIIFMDKAPADNNYSTASGDVLIRQHDALSSGTTMADSDGTMATSVTFLGSGLAKTLASRPYFKLCDSRGAGFARAIIFEPTGRAHVTQPASPGFPAGLTCP